MLLGYYERGHDAKWLETVILNEQEKVFYLLKLISTKLVVISIIICPCYPVRSFGPTIPIKNPPVSLIRNDFFFFLTVSATS